MIKKNIQDYLKKIYKSKLKINRGKEIVNKKLLCLFLATQAIANCKLFKFKMKNK